MPIDLDNGLPGTSLRFHDDVIFLNHIDTCAAMNTGNLLVHQWIISTFPSIVVEYCQYNDANPFEPLSLKCDIDTDNTETFFNKQYNNCLTALVTYKTAYTFEDGSPVTLTYGLGKHVAVNAILGLPTLRKLGIDINLFTSTITSTVIKVQFPIEFASANAALPPNSTFNAESFVRPPVKPHQTVSTCANK